MSVTEPAHAPSAAYDGLAAVRFGDTEAALRVRLAGYLDPIDGQYHWQGTVFGVSPETVKLPQRVTITIGKCSVPARLTERTPWGSYSVAGVGRPPFPLEELQ